MLKASSKPLLVMSPLTVTTQISVPTPPVPVQLVCLISEDPALHSGAPTNYSLPPLGPNGSGLSVSLKENAVVRRTRFWKPALHVAPPHRLTVNVAICEPKPGPTFSRYDEGGCLEPRARYGAGNRYILGWLVIGKARSSQLQSFSSPTARNDEIATLPAVTICDLQRAWAHEQQRWCGE
jgi:hypothetical protein